MNPNHASSSPASLWFEKRTRSGTSRTQGLTLVELLVVLVVLLAMSGILALSFQNGVTITGGDGVERTDEEIATIATMQTVRDALLGASLSEPGYRQDVGALPSRLGGLIENIDNAPEPYDPARKQGWRGPYLFDSGPRYGNYLTDGDNFPDNSNLPGIEEDPAILDAWGKPLLLIEEVVGNENFSRLVSAGPPAGPDYSPTLDSPLSIPATPSNFARGNDLVLFLFTKDPNPTP